MVYPRGPDVYHAWYNLFFRLVSLYNNNKAKKIQPTLGCDPKHPLPHLGKDRPYPKHLNKQKEKCKKELFHNMSPLSLSILVYKVTPNNRNAVLKKQHSHIQVEGVIM